MITAAVVLVVAAGLAAIVAGLRLRYYMRRHQTTVHQELRLQDELHALRSECDRLFWEGSL